MIRFLKSFFNKRSADNRINSPRSSFEAKLSLLTAKQKQLQSQAVKIKQLTRNLLK